MVNYRHRKKYDAYTFTLNLLILLGPDDDCETFLKLAKLDVVGCSYAD